MLEAPNPHAQNEPAAALLQQPQPPPTMIHFDGAAVDGAAALGRPWASPAGAADAPDPRRD